MKPTSCASTPPKSSLTMPLSAPTAAVEAKSTGTRIAPAAEMRIPVLPVDRRGSPRYWSFILADIRRAANRIHRALCQPVDRRPEAPQDRVFTPMPAVAHDPGAADHDVANRIVVAGEDQRVEQRVAVPAVERRGVVLEDDEIGAAARFERTDASPQRGGAVPRRGVPQRPPARAARTHHSSGDVAFAQRQALRAFEQTQ